jgi:hypothetical protein
MNRTWGRIYQNEQIATSSCGIGDSSLVICGISAEEPDEGWLNLSFTDVNSGRVLATIFADKSNGSFRGNDLSSIHFRVLHVKGFPIPLILGIAHATVASDCAYQTIPIGLVHGKIRVLSPRVLDFGTQGGIYLVRLALLSQSWFFGMSSRFMTWSTTILTGIASNSSAGTLRLGYLKHTTSKPHVVMTASVKRQYRLG